MDRESRRRLALGVGVGLLFLLIGYVLLSFVTVVVFSVFLYYAVRPIFHFLTRLGLGRRTRAVLAIALFGIPFLVLIAYAVSIVAIEAQDFFDEDISNRITAELNIGGFDLESLEMSVTGDLSELPVDSIVDSVVGAAGAVGSALVQLLLVVIITYYLLVDGPRLVSWLLDTYDDPGVGRRYANAVDDELSTALFGNIVNVFVTAIAGIAVFLLYNALVDPVITVPYPGLLGALVGIGSLIPVIGIKLVYVPLTVGLGVNAWLADQPELLGPVAVLFVVSAIALDFIPDFVIRALVSSDETHTGLLVIGYILGPTLFGFYGLFLAPILLICTTNAVKILMPYIVSGESAGRLQTTLDQFTPGKTRTETQPGDD
ncbi:MAG: putative permease [halophilic archaeon J07HX64]|jgi:Predicted permease|nr:MAG: putative permease [halophilic archaeon J07HX64]